jgi:heme-degrading monooxygenase HmoA
LHEEESRTMHAIVFEYEVEPAHAARFEEMYGSDGEWARFVRGGAGHLGTELLRDSARTGRYLLIDRWISAEAAAGFLNERAEEYVRRSADAARMYRRERRLGAFDATTSS